MIIVTGTQRSGTSLWMHLLVEGGLPYIGERFPGGWGELLRDANPDGFFESELVAGINYRTNPHPQTGDYLHPATTQTHAVKVFIPGLVRTDVAFVDRVIATVRDWRSYVTSKRRMKGLQRDGGLAPHDAPTLLPPALEWWTQNYALIRDLAVRGYPVHVLSYDSLLREPQAVVHEVMAWVGHGDAERAAAVVRAPVDRVALQPGADDRELAEGVPAEHLAVFDALFQAIDVGRPLDAALVERLNRTNDALRPIVLERQANVDAETIADILGRR